LVSRFAVILMMTAVLAFGLEGTFVTAATLPTPEKSRHHHGHSHSHGVTHVHVDGTVHRHMVDDENGGLARHMKERGSATVAPALAVLPTPSSIALAVVAGIKLAIEPPDPYRGTEPDGPRKPPRPPSIV
jgi:hypothetical protein